MITQASFNFTDQVEEGFLFSKIHVSSLPFINTFCGDD